LVITKTPLSERLKTLTLKNSSMKTSQIISDNAQTISRWAMLITMSWVHNSKGRSALNSSISCKLITINSSIRQ
jgi:hypothetical protein